MKLECLGRSPQPGLTSRQQDEKPSISYNPAQGTHLPLLVQAAAAGWERSLPRGIQSNQEFLGLFYVH